MKKLKVGIVGCGAIGSSLAGAIIKEFRADIELVGLFDIDTQKMKSLSFSLAKSGRLAIDGIDRLINKSDLVIEAASAKVVWSLAQKVINAGRSMMAMSVGGLVEDFPKLLNLARRKGVKVYLPSGAICGIDALKAARLKKIKSVTLVTRKNPKAFKGVNFIKVKGINLEKIKRDLVLFSGPAKEAVKYFPQNINVAAVLSLAGVGAANTKVVIIASPSVNKNIHEVKIESEVVNISATAENVLHPDNPKTSYLAVLSALAVLKDIVSPVKIGT